MTILTLALAQQVEAYLADRRAAIASHRARREELIREAKARAEGEAAADLAALDVRAYRLHAEGVPIRQLALTTDWAQAKAQVENGRKLAAGQIAAPRGAERAVSPAFTGWRRNPGTDPLAPADAHPFLFDWTDPENPAHSVTASYNPDTRLIDIPALWAPPGEVDIDYAAISAFQADDVQSAAKAWCQAQATD